MDRRLLTRLALLEHEFGKAQSAIRYLRGSLLAWQSILRDINPEDERAREEIDRINVLIGRWEAERAALQDTEE